MKYVDFFDQVTTWKLGNNDMENICQVSSQCVLLVPKILSSKMYLLGFSERICQVHAGNHGESLGRNWLHKYVKPKTILGFTNTVYGIVILYNIIINQLTHKQLHLLGMEIRIKISTWRNNCPITIFGLVKHFTHAYYRAVHLCNQSYRCHIKPVVKVCFKRIVLNHCEGQIDTNV